MSDALNLFTIG